ncbi:MAG: lamin tail domain-containing protein, partial [Saprospiraceae bacterium]
MKDRYRLYLLLLLLTGGCFWLRGQCPAAGSVIITEVGPRTPNDPNAEWFEIYNTTSSAIDLTDNTWIISDDDGTSPYTISSVNGTVILPANDFLVFSYGNAFNSSFSPYTTDHVYGALDAVGGVTMTMGGCTDGIAVKCG